MAMPQRDDAIEVIKRRAAEKRTAEEKKKAEARTRAAQRRKARRIFFRTDEFAVGRSKRKILKNLPDRTDYDHIKARRVVERVGLSS